MKETIIIIVIIIIIVGGDILMNKYLENSSQDLVHDLKELENKINNNEDVETIKEQAKHIYKKWEKTEEGWAMLVLHSELDSIETSLIKMKVDIEENDMSLCLEELKTSIFLINHISEKEKFCLKNIF